MLNHLDGHLLQDQNLESSKLTKTFTSEVLHLCPLIKYTNLGFVAAKLGVTCSSGATVGLFVRSWEFLLSSSKRNFTDLHKVLNLT